MNRQELAQKIDTSFDFTTEEYWDGFWENRNGLGGFKDGRDPDLYNSELADVHAFLWSRKTGNKQNPDTELKLKINNDNSLTDINSGIDFSSDTLVNGYRWPQLSATGNGVIPALIRDYGQLHYRAIQERFTHKAYTVGGMIIFPCHKGKDASINCTRGITPKIKDRVET